MYVNDRDKKRDAIKVDKINDETWENRSLGLGGICCSSCLQKAIIEKE